MIEIFCGDEASAKKYGKPYIMVEIYPSAWQGFWRYIVWSFEDGAWVDIDRGGWAFGFWKIMKYAHRASMDIYLELCKEHHDRGN